MASLGTWLTGLPTVQHTLSVHRFAGVDGRQQNFPHLTHPEVRVLLLTQPQLAVSFEGEYHALPLGASYVGFQTWVNLQTHAV